jgi:hypothetical protein
MRQKMISPLSDVLGETEHDRFKRFASAILAVPKHETETPEQAISRLETEKRKIENQIAVVRLAKAKRKAKQRPSRT